jgi:MFS family permease
MLIVESILNTVVSLYLIVVIKENPKFPPSKVSLTKVSSEGSCSDLGKLLKMKNYLLLTFVFSALFAIYIALATVINPLLQPFGYDDGVIAELGACFIVAGVLSTLVTGILLDKSKKYLLTLRVITIASCLSAIASYFILPLSNNLLCFVVITLIGLCLVPIMSIGFAFATELTHPI